MNTPNKAQLVISLNRIEEQIENLTRQYDEQLALLQSAIMDDYGLHKGMELTVTEEIADYLSGNIMRNSISTGDMIELGSVLAPRYYDAITETTLCFVVNWLSYDEDDELAIGCGILSLRQIKTML